jgi:imidazoleglycerol-phosphate dehydratase / histidinol-phosphatase
MDKILWIDRDGTIVEEPHDFTVDELGKIRWVPMVIPALLQLQAAGFRLVMVTNQDGIGSARFPAHKFSVCHDFIMHTLASQGVRFESVLICPHTEAQGCDCRKPKTKLIDDYLQGAVYHLPSSAVIGDRVTDMELATRLGVRGLRIGDGNNATLTWPQIVAALL